MTQPYHPTSTPAGARRATIAGGVAAAGLLLALVVAPPTALLLAVGNPVPEQAVINGRLTDSAVIGMLAAVVWVAWAQLMLAVLVEAIAAVRRAPLPRRIPFTGPQQQLARHLVVAVSFLLAGGAALSSPTAAAAPASAAVASCPPAVDHPDLTDHHRRSAASAPLAKSGSVPDDPGPRSSVIPAQAGVPAVEASSLDRAGRWYTVKPPRGAHHDTLWDIAERHLGDGLRWKEIYDLNRDRPQPDGRRLTTPSLIHPGWRLQLPADAVGLNPENTPSHARVNDEASPSPTARTPDPPAAPPAPKEQGPPAVATAVPSAEANGIAARPKGDESRGTPVSTEISAARDDDEAALPIGALTFGLSGLACTGLIAELARRRRRAERLRRPGQRLRRPPPPTDWLERQLHTANAGLTVTALRGALHQLADHCHRTTRPLPDLYMIQLAPGGATLHFGADEPDAPTPFTATGPRTWTLGPPPDRNTPMTVAGLADDLDGDLDGALHDPVDPYPALVALGVAGEAMMLVNLEAAGVLRISGPAEAAERILWALGLEVGTSELCHSAEVALAGCPPELLTLLDRGRVRATDPGTGMSWIEYRQRDVGALLRGAGVQTMLDARARQVLSDTWAPAVLLESVSSSTTAAPARAAALVPYRGACLITTRPGAPETSAGWTLIEQNGAWCLEPLGIGIEPQQLDGARLVQLNELATVEVEVEDAPVPATSTEPVHDHASSAFAERDGVGLSRARATVGEASLPAAAGSPDPSAYAIADAPTVNKGEAGAPGVGPRVLVLGPVEIANAGDDAQPGRRRRATELITYLALHPGASQHQLDEALWPGVRVSRGTRNPLVSRARQWLGLAPDGEPFVAMIGEGQEYRLHPDVTCDWDDFRALATRGLAAGSAGLDDLEAALGLVRGRPFLGVNPAAYGWAEADIQDMISAIVDVAHALAERALEAGDYRRARWAAARGLAAEPVAEILYRDAIRAARAAGDDEDASRLIELARRAIGEVDPDDDIDLTTAVAAGSLNRR